MTRLLQYPLEQWDQLVAAPWFAAAAVIDSDKSGSFGRGREVDALQEAITVAADATDVRSELVYRIAQQLRDDYDLQPPAAVGNPSWNVALDRVRVAVEVLDALAAPDDSEDYRRWIMEIATAVAQAAREGFAGLGHHVSRDEKAILDELAKDLRLPAGG
jgi:hypothetical protein